MDDAREAGVVRILEKVAQRTGLAPSFLCTIAIGEGMGLWIDAHHDPVPPHRVTTDRRIDGFERLGVDHFDADFERTRRYLPDDYDRGDEFQVREAVNEWGETVRSADFRDLESGTWALGATLALRRDTFLRHARAFGYGAPSADQEAFWIYVYFQGEGRARRYFEANGGFEYSHLPESHLRVREVRRLALERVAAWRLLESKKIFSS